MTTTQERTTRYRSVRVETDEGLRLAGALRYRAYSSCGAIAPREGGLFTDRFDERPNCTTYMLLERDEPIASIRACVYAAKFDHQPIPAFEVYRDAIAVELGVHRTIVESNRFVFDPEYRRHALVPKLHLFRNIASTALRHDADFIITAVRTRHEDFYAKLGFRPISDERTYPGLTVPMVLLACDCRTALPRMQANRAFASILLD
jgi:hypothetical protein